MAFEMEMETFYTTGAGGVGVDHQLTMFLCLLLSQLLEFRLRPLYQKSELN